LLYDTNGAGVEFTVRDTWERNRIYINGGTLGIDGDQRTKLTNLVKAGRIVPYNTRGIFTGPSYNEPAFYNAVDTNTTLSATYLPGSAWNPSPEKYATNVHFKNGLILTWKPGDWVATGGNNGHYVFLGTSFNDVNTVGVGTAGTASSVFIGRRDVNNITLAETVFSEGATYYWRVDEVNLTDSNYKGMIWEF
jgi:hypothetical protein